MSDAALETTRQPYWHTEHYSLAADIFYDVFDQPTRLLLSLPQCRKGNIAMANIELANDWELEIPIQAANGAGNVVPIPPGDVFSATTSPTGMLGAVIGVNTNGNPVVTVNALVPTASSVTLTVSDSAGLTAATQVFDIVADTTATSIVLDVSQATHTSQPVPTAPTTSS